MLEVRNLNKIFVSKDRVFGHRQVHAVKDVTFTIPEGGAISFIGESGCGKTTVGRIVAGLEKPSDGTVLLDGIDVHRVPRKQQPDVMRRIQLIQQDPYQALNPAHTIEETLHAPLAVMSRQKGKVDRAWMQRRMEEVLTLVGLDPATVLYKYPHMLSGGQRQRIVIARALTVEPKVLVADEAVSMIDVSLRLGVLNLLRDLRERLGISVLFITHDVAASRYLGADGQIFVIYKGMVVEHGDTERVIRQPNHPYTQALLSAVPVLQGLEEPGEDRFILDKEITTGVTQDGGCLFADRCPFVQDICRKELPPLESVDGSSAAGQASACHFPAARQVAAMSIDG